MARHPDENGILRYSQWIPGASDSGPDDEPRSFWERMLRQEAKAQTTARQARAMPLAAGLGRPDPSKAFKVTTMAPTRALTRENRTISPESVMGVRRPEFGSTKAEVESRARAKLGIQMENGQATYRPDAAQKQVIKDHLAARGKPTDQVDQLKFVAGLNDEAGFFTRQVFNWDTPEAVTQGNTVYVDPNKFIDVVGFDSDTPFEEAYHSSDFASEGGAGFYPPYIVNALGGFGMTGDEYNGNPCEAFAKGAAREMHEDYRRQQKKPQK